MAKYTDTERVQEVTTCINNFDAKAEKQAISTNKAMVRYIWHIIAEMESSSSRITWFARLDAKAVKWRINIH